MDLANVEIVIVLLIATGLLSGCRPAGSPSTSRPASPTPTSSPTPFPINVRIEGADSIWFDAEGHTIAKIHAEQASAGPNTGVSRSDPVGAAKAATAVLYQNNVPSATFKADVLKTDRDSHVLIGTGNVVVHSLTQADTPTIRADTMTWRYKQDSIVGEGHVLITRNPDLRLPGARFTADTKLRKFTLFTAGSTATGSF